MTDRVVLSLLDQPPNDDPEPSGALTLPVPEGWPAPPDPTVYHGLAGEIVTTIAPHTEADPVAILSQHEAVNVHHQPLCSRARTGLPRPLKTLAEHAVQLTHVPERKRAQRRAQRRRRGHPPQQPVSTPRAQHISVIDAVRAEHHREHERHHLAPRVV